MVQLKAFFSADLSLCVTPFRVELQHLSAETVTATVQLFFKISSEHREYLCGQSNDKMKVHNKLDMLH